MQIIEVKNNLVKTSFDVEEKPFLSGFATIKDSIQAFIAQVIYLESDKNGNYAVLKLLFNFDDAGVITSYNGSIPSADAIVESVETEALLGLLPMQNPVLIGELAQEKTLFNLDLTLLQDNLLICSEKYNSTNVFIKNLASQLDFQNKKTLIIDCSGTFEANNKLTATENIKLPLNYDSINFIYEKGLTDATAETKATIQEIFLEVQNYVKTSAEKFIPFQTFKSVVEEQYDETELTELVLLKNKLIKYNEAGIFAQEKEEFETLKTSLTQNNATVLDLSKADDSIQREFISFAYSVIQEIGEEFYVFLTINDNNTDKKLLKQIFSAKSAYPIIISNYGYKYLKELKQICTNFVLFAPIQQQNDFAGYSVFLNKLSQKEYIIWGKSTQHLPLIVKLEDIQKYLQNVENSKIEEPTNDYEQNNEYQEDIQNEDLEAQIKKDVDEIYTTPRQQVESETIPDENEVHLTEDDLDFLDEVDLENDGEQYFDQNEETQETDSELNEEQTANTILVVDENDEEFEQQAPEFRQQSTFANILNSPDETEEKRHSASDILPVREVADTAIPIYSADIEPQVESDEIGQGDIVSHPKYGKGTVEKMITYGTKTLCSILFDNVGRRLLDPTLAEIKKV